VHALTLTLVLLQARHFPASGSQICFEEMHVLQENLPPAPPIAPPAPAIEPAAPAAP
jgi:hypothetical protein